MAYVADRQCDRCDAGMECLRNEAGGMRPYESYWHCLDGVPDDQAWVECFKSEDDKVDGLLAEADYYAATNGGQVMNFSIEEAREHEAIQRLRDHEAREEQRQHLRQQRYLQRNRLWPYDEPSDVTTEDKHDG